MRKLVQVAAFENIVPVVAEILGPAHHVLHASRIERGYLAGRAIDVRKGRDKVMVLVVEPR
jgi:hypothetical protein